MKERRNFTEYEIEIKEELSRTIKVQAETMEAAIVSIEQKYRSGEIVLDADDFKCVCIESVLTKQPVRGKSR